MKESMPDISFERSMNHNYMILSKCSFFGKGDDQGRDYRTKMLLENHIPGLLPVTHRLINGESRYYYEINSLQSLDRLYDKTEIRYDELRRLLSGCVNLFDRLEEYLLDGAQIIIKPEMVYIDVEKMEPNFVCYPDYEGDVRLSFMEFIDALLTKVDHTDERAVMLGYQVYRYTRNPNYVISEIANMMDHVIVSMAHKEADLAQMAPGVSGGNILSVPANEEEDFVNITDPAGIKEDMQEDHFAICSCGEEHTETAEGKPGRRRKNTGDLVGGIFCIFVSLCAGAIILGARLLHAFELHGNNELYLYGALGMAVVAAVLFFSCYIKKRRQDRETELSDDDGCEDFQYYTAAGEDHGNFRCNDRQPQSFLQNTDRPDYAAKAQVLPYQEVGKIRFPKTGDCGETVYLGDGIVEERMLCGRMNGREVNISLDRLPMTVGKLANVSDFVINDTAVSKMHARFEEHDGRVYLCDLNSTNGTVHNGIVLDVNQSVVLKPGDRLRFGRSCFTYC